MSVDTIDMKKLRAFQLVARLGSLRAAADRLNQSIPAISAKLKRLESEVGVELFERLPNKMILTAAGENFVREVDGLFDKAEQILESLSPKKLAGPLSIGIGSDHARYFVAGISQFLGKNPFLEFSMVVSRSAEAIPALQHGELDVAIGVFPSLPPGLERHEICEASIVLICPRSSSLSSIASPSLVDIAKHRLILLRKSSETRRVVDASLSRNGVRLGKIIEVGNCGTATLFVEQGMGVALVHSLAIDESRAGSVKVANLGHLFEKVRFCAVYRTGSKNFATTKAFLSELTIPRHLQRDAVKAPQDDRLHDSAELASRERMSPLPCARSV